MRSRSARGRRSRPRPTGEDASPAACYAVRGQQGFDQRPLRIGQIRRYRGSRCTGPPWTYLRYRSPDTPTNNQLLKTRSDTTDRTRSRRRTFGDHGLSPRSAELGGQPSQVDAVCLQQQSRRVGPAGDPAEPGQLPAAAAAELGAERVAGIAQHAVEQMFWPDPRISPAVSESGCDLEGAFGQYVDA